MSLTLNMQDKGNTRLLIENIMKIGTYPQSIEDVFHNFGKLKAELDINVILRGDGFRYFDAIPAYANANEKKTINDMFEKQLLSDEKSIFHIPSPDEKALTPLEKLNTRTLRIMFLKSYNMQYSFPALRDKLFDLYSNHPSFLYKNCSTFKHYELLKEHMRVPIEEKLSGVNINHKITVLNNFLDVSERQPEYLESGWRDIKITPSSKEYKEAKEKNEIKILEWAKKEILHKEIDSEIINSAVSSLIKYGYSNKKLTEEGFPPINWDTKIQIHNHTVTSFGRENKIRKGNHFYNISKNKKINAVKKSYTLKPEDWRRLYCFEAFSSLAKESERKNLNELINRSLKDNGIKQITPDGDIGDSLFPLAVLKNEYKNIPIGRNGDYLQKCLSLLKENNYDIYEIKEKDGEKYSIFTNAFLSQRFPLIQSTNSSFIAMEEFNNAPINNIEIIENYFSNKAEIFIKEALDIFSKNGKSFVVHFPLFELFSKMKNITPELTDTILNVFENHKAWKLQESEAHKDPTKLKIIESILNSKSQFETYQKYFKTKDILNDIPINKESDTSNNFGFKL